MHQTLQHHILLPSVVDSGHLRIPPLDFVSFRTWDQVVGLRSLIQSQRIDQNAEKGFEEVVAAVVAVVVVVVVEIDHCLRQSCFGCL